MHRIFSLFYWNTLELVFWGFMTLWMKNAWPADSRVNFVVVLLGALIFWDLFSRVQQTITMAFLEDVWSRNLINIFTAPVTFKEFIAGFLLLSIAQGMIAFVFMTLLAWALYALEIWELGFFVVPFFLNILLFGWALGFVTVGLIVRFGPSVEMLAWSIPVLFQPLSAVFYPLSILPDALQKIAFFIPTSHLFEGMRAVLLNGTFPVQESLITFVLNIAYMFFGVAFFYWMLRLARRKGLLSKFTAD